LAGCTAGFAHPNLGRGERAVEPGTEGDLILLELVEAFEKKLDAGLQVLLVSDIYDAGVHAVRGKGPGIGRAYGEWSRGGWCRRRDY
jgi:hypothetical protein